MTRARCNRIEKRGVQKKTKMKEEARAESPFFGFSNCDIPQPIVIKTEPVEEGDTMDCVVVKVTKAAKPLPATLIKKEKEDDDDIDTFHGFSLADLPKPIVIKEEPTYTEASVEEKVSKPASIIPISGDKILNEFETPTGAGVDSENNANGLVSTLSADDNITSKSASPEINIRKCASSPSKTLPSSPVNSVHTRPPYDKSPPGPPSPPAASLPKKIQIIDENGEKIELITQESEGDFDTGDETDEDHEFTVVVEENDSGEVTTITQNVNVDEKNVIEADSIEDIIAQFEHSESTNGPRSVSCPNCRKCFVSNHFLNLHISNATTMCELCNTQCCSQVNLRNHKNLECDLSKRKRNIDLIAKETALLGRKPIEPEKYYDMPIEDEEENEDEEHLDDERFDSPSPAKKHKPELETTKPEELSEEVNLYLLISLKLKKHFWSI